jgi:chemotaxis protein methyltransferase CheR
VIPALWSEVTFEVLARLVAERTGLAFAPHRCASLEQAARRAMATAELTDLGEFTARLASGALSWDPLIAEMTVGETYFFRDVQQFAFVREHVLPAIRASYGATHGVRVWSAGCASGEEAFSLGILLRERGLFEGAFILGTDLSQAALARARAGEFRKWSLRGLEPQLIEAYFVEVEAGLFALAPAIRECVTFRELNLASVDYPSTINGASRMDLIFCRNVLIYLQPDTIRAVGERLFASLVPGGWLVTGPSDPLLSEAGFEVQTTSVGVVYRRPETALRAPSSKSRAPEVPRTSRPTPASVPPDAVAPVVLNSAEVEPALHLSHEQARQAFDAEDQAAVLRLAQERPSDAVGAASRVRALSNSHGARVAEQACAEALLLHPLSGELHYLHGVLLLGRAQFERAAEALRHAIYLDRSLAIAHFTLGSVLAQLEKPALAERAYRNARDCLALHGGGPIALGDGISAGGLATAVTQAIELLANDRRAIG